MPSSWPVATKVGSGLIGSAATHDSWAMAVRICPEETSHKVRSLLAEARTRASPEKHHSVSRSLSDCQSSCSPLSAFQCRNTPGSSTDQSVPSGAKVSTASSPSVWSWGSPKICRLGTMLDGDSMEVMNTAHQRTKKNPACKFYTIFGRVRQGLPKTLGKPQRRAAGLPSQSSTQEGLIGMANLIQPLGVPAAEPCRPHVE